MKTKVRLLVLLLITCTFSQGAIAQKKNSTFVAYIEKYKKVAIDHQKKYQIPASITLAQGLLESGAGTSSFVKKSNNHFGIKCHSDWKGETVYQADDGPNDCFRKYKNAAESFEDHSLFLKRPRYASLFKLKITDYKGWAKGLQDCGYATDKAYANKLIKLIEDYQLYEYDKKNGKSEAKYTGPKNERDIYKTHGLIYVISRKNDSFESIAYDLDFKTKSLIKYNEVPEGFPLQEGDIVYLQKKKKKADKPYYEHVVQVGESMHSISQRYGMQFKQLYKINKKKAEYIPEEGDVLRLR